MAKKSQIRFSAISGSFPSGTGEAVTTKIKEEVVKLKTRLARIATLCYTLHSRFMFYVSSKF